MTIGLALAGLAAIAAATNLRGLQSLMGLGAGHIVDTKEVSSFEIGRVEDGWMVYIILKDGTTLGKKYPTREDAFREMTRLRKEIRSGMNGFMGLRGTPEEHLAKFREYLMAAQRPGMSDRQRMAFLERARAEASWSDTTSADDDALIAAEVMVYGAPKSNFVVQKKEKRGVDPRHPPEGWKIAHSTKGNTWLIVSTGGGNYEARRGGQIVFAGTGNTVLTKIHGHPMDVYNALNLKGTPGKKFFDPMNPPSGWYR